MRTPGTATVRRRTVYVVSLAAVALIVLRARRAGATRCRGRCSRVKRFPSRPPVTRAVLEGEYLPESRGVLGKRVHRKLGRSHLEALCLEAFDDATAARPVRPGATDKNDVRPAVH